MAATMSATAALAAKPCVARPARRSTVKVQAAAYNGQYAEELVQTAVSGGGQWWRQRSRGLQPSPA